MPGELHDEIAGALVDVLRGLDIRADKWGPRNIKPLCAVVQLPVIRRTDPDGAEDHLGARDWRLEYPVYFYNELTEKPQPVQAELLKQTVRFIDAIDELTPGAEGLVLSDLCADAKVTQSIPFVEPREGQKRDLIGYETTVSILTFK
ncbi:MAG TPA: hypothetical protein VFN92_13445 [Solirubrobacterales bacterium]|nr:hypothetical protein [Solirubrobacterales bacterium]